MLNNEGIQLLNAVIQSSTEVTRPVLVITLCSALALTSYSQSKLLPMGTAGLVEMVNGKKVRGRRRHMIDNITINRLYSDRKGKTEKKVEWRMLSLQ